MKKCSECEYAKFVDYNGNPNRYYCSNEEARFAQGCRPEPMICRTDRHSTEMKIKTSPRWCPFRKTSKEQKGQQGKKYVTDRGLVAFVSNGFGKGGKWMSVARKDTFQGTHRIVTKNLPLRDTREEAQADLDAYAKKKGWKEA